MFKPVRLEGAIVAVFRPPRVPWGSTYPLLDPPQLAPGHPGRQGNVPVLDPRLPPLAGERQLDELALQGGLAVLPGTQRITLFNMK